MDDEILHPATWLLDNLYNKPAVYRYLGEESPADMSVLHAGWGGLVHEKSEGGYVESAYPDAPRFIGVPCTTWGDYCGDDVQRSNHRCLEKELEPYGVKEVRGDFYSFWLVLPADAMLPEHLLNGLREIADEYPIWDESDYSELEWELQQSDWEDWACMEFRTFLHNAVTGEGPESWVANLSDEQLGDMVWEAMSNDEVDWQNETATGGYFRGLEELADRIGSEHMAQCASVES